MSKLDTDKLVKVLALAGSNQDGEALAAVRKARDMLKAAGKTFADLTVKGVAEPAAPRPAASSGPAFTDISAGFDSFMEKKEPGWKAKQAAAHAERIRKEAEEREAIIAKYGSYRRARLPNERERLLDKATVHLKRKVTKPSFNGGTYQCDSLDGWTWSNPLVDTVRAAVEAAYPMPVTLREAREEYRFWRARDRELEMASRLPGQMGGDSYLTFPACAREQAIWEMLRKGPVVTLDDLLVRIEEAAEEGGDANDAIDSILEAFKRLVPNAPAEGITAMAWTPPLRLVLMDVPGQPLALAVHDQAGERVAVTVKPMDALALAVDLTSSARRRLAGGAS